MQSIVKIEDYNPPIPPVRMSQLMSSSKFVMSSDLLGLTGTNCPANNFVPKLNSTCSCISNNNGSKKTWSLNSNYGDMYMCQ